MPRQIARCESRHSETLTHNFLFLWKSRDDHAVRQTGEIDAVCKLRGRCRRAVCFRCECKRRTADLSGYEKGGVVCGPQPRRTGGRVQRTDISTAGPGATGHDVPRRLAVRIVGVPDGKQGVYLLRYRNPPTILATAPPPHVTHLRPGTVADAPKDWRTIFLLPLIP